MKWKLFADLAEVAGDRVVRVDVPDGATVDDALDALLEDCPELGERVLDEDETLQSHVNLLCNGEAATLDETVSEGDELALFPPVSGGRR